VSSFALGQLLAQALLGKQFSCHSPRGEFVTSPLAPFVIATYIRRNLANTGRYGRDTALRQFLGDLQKVAGSLTST